MVVLDEKLITRAWEGKLNIVIHDQLEQVHVEVEKQFHENCLSDEVINELRLIQCIIGDAEKIGEDKDLDLFARIDNVLVQIELANAEINSYDQKYQKPLLDKILEDINKILYSCKEKLKIVRSQLESVYNNLTAIAQLGTKLTRDAPFGKCYSL